MADRELQRWVGDQLHDVAGFSDKLVVDLIIGMGKAAKSSQTLLAKLTADGTLSDGV